MPVIDAFFQIIPDTPTRNTHVIWEDDASIFVAFTESFAEILLCSETFLNVKGTTIEEATCRWICARSGRWRRHSCVVHWRLRRRRSISGPIDCLKDHVDLTFELCLQVSEHCFNHQVLYFYLRSSCGSYQNLCWLIANRRHRRRLCCSRRNIRCCLPVICRILGVVFGGYAEGVPERRKYVLSWTSFQL